VVALRAGAVPEVVVDKVTGLICDEPAELADAVRQVGSIDPAACRSHVAKRFNVDQLGADYERVYRSVVEHLTSLQARRHQIIERSFEYRPVYRVPRPGRPPWAPHSPAPVAKPLH
jgi:hypothetical protein